MSRFDGIPKRPEYPQREEDEAWFHIKPFSEYDKTMRGHKRIYFDHAAWVYPRDTLTVQIRLQMSGARFSDTEEYIAIELRESTAKMLFESLRETLKDLEEAHAADDRIAKEKAATAPPRQGSETA